MDSTNRNANGVNGKRWLSASEAAEQLSYGTREINRLCADGKIEGAWRPEGPNARWKIPQAGLDAYVAERQAATKRVSAVGERRAIKSKKLARA